MTSVTDGAGDGAGAGAGAGADGAGAGVVAGVGAEAPVSTDISPRLGDGGCAEGALLLDEEDADPEPVWADPDWDSCSWGSSCS